MPHPSPARDTAASRIAGLPLRWFRNIIRIQEKKDYSTSTVLLFCAFVGIARVLGEWFLGARQLSNIALDGFGHLIFYWYSFFSYGLILFLLVPQPWRKSINVVLIGIFLGIFPPIIDLLVSGIGVLRYSYFWGFPEGWNVFIYNPERSFHFGETLVLWFTIFFTGAYVGHKTKSPGRAALGALLAYGVVVFNAGILPSSLQWFVRTTQLDTGHLFYLVLAAQTVLCVALYLWFRPNVFYGLMARTHHSLPFVFTTWLGAAFVGRFNALAVWNGFLVWLMFQAALVQNDFFDRQEDSYQGRQPYVDGEDVTFFTISALLLASLNLLLNTGTGLMLFMVLVLSFLYSYPFYRGKRYFPSNLKMEGGWGLSAFLAGMLGALEFGQALQPRWIMAADNNFGLAPATPGWSAIAACFLIFGGHSLLAILKDYKDVDADNAAGIHTVYSLALRRGYAPAAVHRWVIAITTLCLALPLPLLALRGMANAAWVPGGIAAAIALGFVSRGVKEKRSFDRFLWLMSAYLGYLLIALL